MAGSTKKVGTSTKKAGTSAKKADTSAKKGVASAKTGKLSEEELHQLIGRCMKDVTFRSELFNDPADTMKENGYPVDPEVVKAIESFQSKDQKLVDAVAQKYFETPSSKPGGSSF